LNASCNRPSAPYSKRKAVCDERGFTLVELVVAITVSAVIIGFIALFIATPMQAYFAQARRAELVSEAEVTLRSIANDLQTATPGSVSVIAGGATLKIGNGAAAIRYLCNTATRTLQRRIGAANALVAQDLSGCNFDYQGIALHDKLVGIQLQFSRLAPGQTTESLTVFQQAPIG